MFTAVLLLATGTVSMGRTVLQIVRNDTAIVIMYSHEINFSGITPANRNRLGRNFTERHSAT